MVKQISLASVALMASCFTTHAIANNSASIGAGNTSLTVTVPSGALGAPAAFNDVYSFTLAAPGSFSYQVTEIEKSYTFLGPSGIQDAQLYDIVNSSFSYGLYNASNSLVTTLNNLGAGSYFFKVSGTTSGVLGGQYSMNLNVASAVPEPDKNALFLLGLGALGFIARRKVS